MSDKITEERNDRFDSAMRENLAGYEPAVPHALWSRISAELGETDTTPSIQHYKTTTAPNKWKIAIAAAIVITLGAGALLWNVSAKHEIAAASSPAAPKANVVTTTTTIAAIPVAKTKAVAQATASIKKQSTATAKPAIKALAADAAHVTATTAPENITTNQTNEDSELAATPLASQNNTVDVSNIPVYSLNKLSSPVSLNDEITVIKSAPTAKKHRRHNDEESTKVIVIGKKYDTAPGIRYELPVRF